MHVQVQRTAEALQDGDATAPTALPHGNARKYVIDEVGGTLRHASPPAAWTEAAALARESDQTVVTALGAPEPRKASRKATARQKVPKRTLDEARQPDAVSPIGQLRTERLEVIANHLNEHVVLRRPRAARG